jgi:ADP-heptose:LPS heptosyltransferase
VGTGAESDVITAITQGLGIAPFINLCNQTSFNDIAELGRHAAIAIGNDTGPMHIIAATGTRSLVLFSHASNPALCAPRGSHIHILRRETLEKLLADDVIQTLIDGDILDSHTNAAYSNAK